MKKRNTLIRGTLGSYSGSNPSSTIDKIKRTYTHQNPQTIITYHKRSDKKYAHPTQKPVALMEYLIKTYTNKGETVLDFTIGSGTTAVACIRTKRKFIGIEIDETYYKIAKKRIRREQNKPTLGIVI